MTTPERTVEDEHLAIHMKCLSKSKNARECGDLTVIPMGYAVQMIEEAIQAERQRCEEMVGQIRLLIAKYAKEDDMDVSGLVNEINALCK